jgi:hypothetical protein
MSLRTQRQACGPPSCRRANFRLSNTTRAPHILMAVTAAIGALMIACAMSWAHSHIDERGIVSWYPVECCHDGECRPAERLKIAAGGEWFRTTDGITILADWRAERRPSKDNRWHICIGADDTEVPFVRCIFEPSSS